MTDRPVDVASQQTNPAAEIDLSRSAQLISLADRLAEDLRNVNSNTRGVPILVYLEKYEVELARFHRHFQQASVQELTLSYASEWILDNYYIIRQTIQQIGEDLPQGFLVQLPKLTSPPYQSFPRVYVAARSFLSVNHLQVEIGDLEGFLNRFQEKTPLTMGELWAVPIFLRFAIIETLTHILVRIVRPEGEASLPTPPLDLAVSDDEAVASSIISLRTIANQDWKVFFEDLNLVDRTLRLDPAQVYERMDFKSRDLYRKAVEELSFSSGIPEKDIAAEVLSIARHAARMEPNSLFTHSLEEDNRSAHVGYYLLDEGRPFLEKALLYRPSLAESAQRWLHRRPTLVYLGSILLITAAIIFVLALVILTRDGIDWRQYLAFGLSIIPAVTIGTNLTNWLVTSLQPPSVLPKLEFKDAVPPDLHTLVVVPSLLSSQAEVESLSLQLEQHYLRNPSPGLHFAILSDLVDADSESIPEDQSLIDLAIRNIEKLNKQYRRADGDQPFFLLHRRRAWNPAEGKWIGWERKRGKLHELNQLLRGSTGLTFSHMIGDLQTLNSIRYVITLDADTILPNGAANRLIGALAHPLNQAVFASGSGEILSGYSILQPRVEINPRSANASWFSRIYSGDIGLDLYSRAVSDVYQDFFGEGIYVGKGIYDVDAFERSTRGLIPENTLLSHDLFEGLLGCAGLVTDITLVEDYPSNYFAHARRQHRWIRGDWQLLPWLLFPRRAGVRLSTIDRWMILDNLRRSLLPPALLPLFLAAWTVLPGSPMIWTLLGVLSLAIPLMTNLAMGITQVFAEKTMRAAVRAFGSDFLRWLLAVIFLPFEALNAIDAILTTLYRVLVSRRNMLQWTSAAHTALMFKKDDPVTTAWREMGLVSILVVFISAIVAVARPENLPTALPLVILWLISPQVAIFMNRPIRRQKEVLSTDEVQQLRSIARHTWGFFEQFVGPEDNWLPPDHYQESPLGIVAHRTSPTNIGLLLTSTIGAYELGYIDQFTLAARVTATFDTLVKLERYRGHFINWLDTRSLQPLTPRYVSTVDSGNLAACLLATAQSLLSMREARVFRWQRWLGIQDTFAMLEETLQGLGKSGTEQSASKLLDVMKEVRSQIQAKRHQSEEWYDLFQEISGPVWQEITHRLSDIVDKGEEGLDMEALRRLLQAAQQVENHLAGVQRTIHELVPWMPLMEKPPHLLTRIEYQEDWNRLRSLLPYSPIFGEIARRASESRTVVERIINKLAAISTPDPECDEALTWVGDLVVRLLRAGDNATALLDEYDQVAQQAQTYVDEMDFGFLYDPMRRVFHIGYNLDAARLDNNYYDLLASEARITSLIAIAKGDIPQEHWLHINRPITNIDGMRVLLSWSGTMFEYLMPPLFLRSFDETLLDQSTRGAVIRQMEYGREKGVPWGISESGFYRFDANQNYQYRAFGVPGLGFKRGLGDDLVISPYASLMAVGYQPKSVLRNTAQLARYGMLGLYGFYESIDFTESRLLVGQKFGIVRSYMSHHQGMILLALLDYLKDDLIVKRMHADPRIKSVELLLQEQIPFTAPTQNPESEDVTGTQRLIPEPVEIQPWIVPIQTPIPQVHLLSNGSFNALISNSGSGSLSWNDVDLTRWHADPVIDRLGSWIYLEDMDAHPPGQQRLFSISNQPVPGNPDNNLVTFHSHMAVFRRVENEIAATMEVTVPPDDPVEIRRLHVSNPTDQPRRLRLTSYGEVILTSQANDARHPAFNNLFIQSEYISDLNLLIFQRRTRSSKEKPIFLGHMLLTADGLPVTGAYETDRARFLGRGRDAQNPAALSSPEYLSGSAGSTLDPVFALGQVVELPPHGTTRLGWFTFAGESREEVLMLATRYQNWAAADRAFHQAHIAIETRLRNQEIDGQSLSNYLQLLSGLLYPMARLRSDPDTIAANRGSQSGLWPFGVSGDYPILLVRIQDPQRLDLVLEALQAHRFWRERGYKIDLVVMNEQQTNYGAELNRLLFRLIARTNSDNWLNQRGGIFVLYADQMNPEEKVLLLTVARVVLEGEKGSLIDQLPGYSVPIPHLPDFIPSQILSEEIEPTPPPPELEDLRFFNGYGGFSPDGREYVIDMPAGHKTPLPWSNVIGYPDFGFLVTESGSSSTWAVNSGENRLTPWSNDPVSDPTGEALYLRDEETGAVWTPTPLPAGEASHYRVRHGAGYTQFEHHSHGLRQRLRLFANPEDPVKIIQLRLENVWNRPRRITATQYVEWVLGTLRTSTQPYIIPEYLPEQEALLASNPYNSEFRGRVAFLAASKKIHGMTADRMEFIGRNGTLQSPAALTRIGLEERVIPGEHPCGVLQVHIDLAPGESEEIYFIIGQGKDRRQALALIEKYRINKQVEQSWRKTQEFWESLLSTIQVQSPDPAVDLLLNRWLLYQTLSCRIWGRTAFYQSSGAFGFRDQLQDVMSVLPVAPDIARHQILLAAQHQFEEGDVLHWWHPPSGRGVRTRISDDLLWLPYVVTEYIRATGDTSVLAEEVPFLKALPLREDEEERYGEYPLTKKTYTIWEHCRRAVEKGSTRGPHGLPLIGTGDWNDGMSRIGVEGRGESVWLAWFLIETLDRFAWLCDVAAGAEGANRYRQQAAEYKTAVEALAWDGEWYLRAFYDNGAPLGSILNKECQIDAIAQSWAVLSGAGDPQRAHQAMESVHERLIRPDDRLLLLFTPPFDRTPRDPGYIKGYVPGIRENGGQYTHASTWTVWAYALLRQGSRAGYLYELLNPIYQADSLAKANGYKVEPYVIAADIYSTPPHVRRGGWTWYTGSSGWMYRLGLTALLGLTFEGEGFRMDPVIPAKWEGFEIRYSPNTTVYHIQVSNPDHVETGIVQITLDGQPLPSNTVPYLDTGKEHVVKVTMGKGKE